MFGLLLGHAEGEIEKKWEFPLTQTVNTVNTPTAPPNMARFHTDVTATFEIVHAHISVVALRADAQRCPDDDHHVALPMQAFCLIYYGRALVRLS